MHTYEQAGRLQYAPRPPAPAPRIDVSKMARLATISGTLLAVLAASPQAGLAFVPAPPALAGATTNGLWGSAAPASASTAASIPVPAGFFGPAMQSGRRRGATTMMAAAASAGQATKVINK